MAIEIRFENPPPAREIAELFRVAPLIRPVHDVERIERTYAGSNLVLVARDGERLVAILRGWTDGAYDGYICDLAVHPEYQGQGVGRSLLARVRQEFPDVQFILRASKIAKDYYRGLGWQAIENGWFWPRPSWE